MSEVDSCFHLASAVGVQLICDKPLDSLLRNVRGCDTVIGAASHHDVRLVYASTSEIYGKDSVGALHEESDRLLGPPQLGRWSYANAKVFGEMLALGHTAEHGARATRGPPLQHRRPAPDRRLRHGPSRASCARRSNGDDLTVFGDGTQSRCFAHVRDVVDGARARARERRGDRRGLQHRLLDRDHDRRAGRARDRAHRVVLAASRFVPFEEAYADGFEELGRRKPDTGALEAAHRLAAAVHGRGRDRRRRSTTSGSHEATSSTSTATTRRSSSAAEPSRGLTPRACWSSPSRSAWSGRSASRSASRFALIPLVRRLAVRTQLLRRARRATRGTGRTRPTSAASR